MKRILMVSLLLLVAGCPNHDDRPAPIDAHAVLVARLTQTASDRALPVKDRQRALQQMRKLGVHDWSPSQTPSGRFYLLAE